MLTVVMTSMAESNKAKTKAIETPAWYEKLWYENGLIKSLIYYSKVREFLHSNNLFAPKEDLRRNISCNKNVNYRTADGSCNSFEYPLMGAANTRFSRMMSDDYAQSTLHLNSPSPRTLSLELLSRDKYQTMTNSNLLSTAFLHFVLHDFFSHDEDQNQQLQFLDLDPNDPIRVKYGQSQMAFWGSADVSKKNSKVPEYINKTTHWFDASQLYGSDLATQSRLRSFVDGQMKYEGAHLPLDQNGVEIAGDVRNWWLGLSLMHNLFTREHNKIAEDLKRSYPKMSDEELFQKARLINSAVITKIFLTEQVLPKIVNSNFQVINLANWYGVLNVLANFRDRGQKLDFGKIGTVDYDNNLDSALKFVRVNIPEATGILGSKINYRNTPYAMTEEWAHVYRYHSLLPDNVELVDGTQIPVSHTRGDMAHKLIEYYGAANLIKDFGYQKTGSIALKNTPKFMQEVNIPVLGRVDIAALDIYRERERGIPKFNQIRRIFGLKPYQTFNEITSNKDLASKMAELYNNDIEAVDTTIGIQAEDRTPGLEVGETTTQILAIFASRRIEADRFYTTDFNAKTYTSFGIEHINKATFKKVILRNYPELNAELNKINNASMLWSKKRATKFPTIN